MPSLTAASSSAETPSADAKVPFARAAAGCASVPVGAISNGTSSANVSQTLRTALLLRCVGRGAREHVPNRGGCAAVWTAAARHRGGNRGQCNGGGRRRQVADG